MKFYQVDQYTKEWSELRKGMPTASFAHLFITPDGKPKNPDTQERKRYLYKLVAERILQIPMPSSFDGNEHTERGHALEERATQSFFAQSGYKVAPGGFCRTDDGRYGCSPDGLMRNKREALEVKCPAVWTHMQYMCEGPGDKYKAQVQMQIMIGEFDCVHFWSYHPDFAPVHVVTLPDERYIARLHEQLDLFYQEIQSKEGYVRRHGNVGELIIREVKGETS